MFWVSPVVHNHASYTLTTAMRGCLGNLCNKAGIKELTLHLAVALSSASELLDLNAILLTLLLALYLYIFNQFMLQKAAVSWDNEFHNLIIPCMEKNKYFRCFRPIISLLIIRNTKLKIIVILDILSIPSTYFIELPPPSFLLEASPSLLVFYKKSCHPSNHLYCPSQYISHGDLAKVTKII